MKSLIPWICFFAASASQQALADNDFDAYRLGNYNKALEPLISKTGKDAVADYYLGRVYLYGYGQLKNTDLAMRYFLKSAEKGYLPAVQLMAKYSLMHDKNPEQAVKWYKQAASEGDINAQLFLAAAYLYGLGVKKNTDVASHYYIDAAKSGNPLAQFALAENFIDSRHSGNTKLGLIWLNKAAANGNPKALTKLAGLYLAGKLVTKDVNKATELLTKAVEQNYTPAMVELGNLALTQGNSNKALDWFNMAAKQKDPEAYLELAHAYLQEKSPIYDPNSGFLWTLKAAQEGFVPAQKELSALYQKGLGVAANQELASEWAARAIQDEKAKPVSAFALAALWLSNGRTDKLENTPYQMSGIFSAWKNPLTWRNNNYNLAPQMETISRQDIFKPRFELTQPNDIPITAYYDALSGKSYEFPANQWTYPLYPLNPQMVSLEKVNSMVLAKQDLPAPYLEASYYGIETEPETADIIALFWLDGWQKQANYSTVFNQMYFRAILGDPQSQFEIGQMFQYGIGVAQNDQAAIVFYQNAAEQQHLGAEYNLGVLYLEHAKEDADYQTALNWLTDSAFKGNDNAQYVLARLLDQGKIGADGKELIKANHEQAISMLYLSAANGFGPAQYQLADYLAHEGTQGLSVEVKKHKLALIRQLYTSAVDNGVAQAYLPLAFYNAMDEDQVKQQKAFATAEEQANSGDEKAALLLAMLYDRGIGTAKDPAKAIYWYQQAGNNPVSQFILGTYTTEGRNIALDKDRGADLLRQSAAAQFPYADFNLAVLAHDVNQPFLPDLVKSYELGNNHAGIVLADYYLAESEQNSDPAKLQQAKQIYTGLAEKGDSNAQLKLAYMLDKGLGSTPDPIAAQRWYTASAEQGNALGQYLLGQFYQVGQIGEPDYNLAKEWYQKSARHLAKASVALGFLYETVDDDYAQALKSYETAANQGDKYGIYNLALMYEYGKGIAVDYPRARALFTDASDKGFPEAMNQLASMYFYGLGQARNDQMALAWYKKAASLGNSNALYTLGLLSETGVTTKLDFQAALKYYEEASQQGNEKAMLALARMYHYGLGVNQDQKRSATLYQKLADRQNAYAQYQLGTYYLDGTAGERIPDKGKFLLEQASQNGNKQARQVLQRLEANQGKVSFIEPIEMNDVPALESSDADRIYLDALNEWNRGDESMSRMILQRLVTQYPNFIPAKRAYEQINQAQLGNTYS
ncbi:SEL1-like repeat protein [Legionella sp. km772]|uniref:SEL1-like repeat protein n=1 Tax=Legionella sp. km772 TaxID=2498111 RepID=UPI000F8E3146|nr:SEL1-like repeat protein [Legionella sp. km772]RUR07952.1 endopeptidase IV [Legionella sp. km772]